MEFILQQQAKAEIEMAAIRKLIRAGMKMVVKNEELAKENQQRIKELAEAHKLTQAELRELAAAQKVTEAKLQSFIDSLRRGGNGRHSKN